jgi:hypothetical protein
LQIRGWHRPLFSVASLAAASLLLLLLGARPFNDDEGPFKVRIV